MRVSYSHGLFRNFAKLKDLTYFEFAGIDLKSRPISRKSSCRRVKGIEMESHECMPIVGTCLMSALLTHL